MPVGQVSYRPSNQHNKKSPGQQTEGFFELWVIEKKPS